jgi:hypothetical protein
VSAERGRPYNSKRQAHCAGKARFDTPGLAHRVLARFCRGSRRRERRDAVVYRCQYCGGWHLGAREL